MNHKTLSFTKMHGLGNDFIIIMPPEDTFDIKKIPIKTLANRQMGIGFDQLLILKPSKKADFFCQIFNADGSEAEQCGNGLRCIARYLHEKGLHTQSSLSIETLAGIFAIHIKDYDHIRVTLHAPQLQEKLLKLTLANTQSVQISTLSVGNPHAILRVNSIDEFTSQLGEQISSHTHFPQGTNVGFMQIITPQHIRLRTYERGAGETHACGSNACAATVAGITNGWLDHQVNVEFRYGSLLINWEGTNQPIYMTGPATKVFSGEIELS